MNIEEICCYSLGKDVLLLVRDKLDILVTKEKVVDEEKKALIYEIDNSSSVSWEDSSVSSWLDGSVSLE